MQLFIRNRILLAFLLFVKLTAAQTLPSKNITINDGLPSNSIKCFFKDSRGLLWIGTEAGLCCYDGSTYKIFNEINGLKNNEIWSIAEDNKHNLWLSLYGNGLAKFDGKKFTYFDQKDGLINNKIRKIHYSKKYNCLILGTENGLSLFDGKHFKSFIKKTVKYKFQVVGIDETTDKILITVSYDSNVFNLEINSDIQQSKLIKEFTPIPSYSSYTSNGTYFGGGASQSLYVKDLKTNIESAFPCPIIWNFAKDDENNIYCAAWNVNDPNGGLFKYTNGKLEDITKQANISSTGLWCLYYDKETHQLWVGSIDKGIYRVDLSRQKQFFEPSYFGLNQLEIQQLYNDSHNNTWIGARDNIIIQHDDLSYTLIDKKVLCSKMDVYFKKYGLRPYTIGTNQIFKNLKSFTCFNIVSDIEGYIWVNTTIGTFCFDKKFDIRYFNYSVGRNIIFDNNDQAIYGEIYSNINIKLNKFDSVNYKSFSIDNPNVPRDIQKIVKNGNTIWFATSSSGLYCYKNNQFYSLNLNHQFNKKNIKDIIINNKDELVIGTNSGRIYITKWVENKLKILHTYQPYKELYGTSVSFIEQTHGSYFIGTNKGINVIKDNRFVKLINQSEGINDVQFNDCSKDKNGNLWIATNNGLIFIDSNKFTKKELLQNPIRITGIKVNGIQNDNSTNWGCISDNNLKLSYNQNDVEITFGSYNILNADKNVFRYKIIGLSNNWSDFENDGKIQLRGITNGNYKILIEGKNIGTGALFQPKILNLIITPPFWKTGWFISFVILLLLIIGYVSYKKRVAIIANREQAKGIIQKRLAETKMEALQSQMNPHFIFNAMNSIQNFIIDSNIDDALMYLGEFSKLIRQTLDNSSKPRICLSDEIHYLKTYVRLENMRLKNKVNFKLDVSDDIDIYDIEIPPMILQPFIENVFVHAFDANSLHPKLELTFRQNDQHLICEVKDNGKGITDEKIEKLHTSKGINLVKERISLFQQINTDPINVFSNPSEGTTIILSLKIDYFND